MNIKIKKLYPDVKTPIRGTAGAVGLDVFAYRCLSEGELAEKLEIKHPAWAGMIIGYGTGLAFEPPDCFYLGFRARSSIHKHGLSLCNSVGTIDPDYRGEVLAFFYTGLRPAFPYKIGDRIGQIILMRDYRPEIESVDELTPTERGAGGYGSTGR